MKGHGGGGRAASVTTNRARGTQYKSPSGAPRGSNATKTGTKGSPLPKGYGQQRSADVEGNYQRGKRVGRG